jgi:hypothetical protein
MIHFKQTNKPSTVVQVRLFSFLTIKRENDRRSKIRREKVFSVLLTMKEVVAMAAMAMAAMVAMVAMAMAAMEVSVSVVVVGSTTLYKCDN